MSLRFERKTTNKLRNTFSCRSRVERDGLLQQPVGGSGVGGSAPDPGKTWSFRQGRFACDYLNLMDPIRPAPNRGNNSADNLTSSTSNNKMPPIMREKSGSGLRSLPVASPKVPAVLSNPDVLHISEEDLCQCEEGVIRGGGVPQMQSSNKRLPPILSNGGANASKGPSKERCVSFNFNSDSTMPINRRGSLASVNSSSISSSSYYAASTVSSSSSLSGSSNLYEDLMELGFGVCGLDSSLDFKDLVSCVVFHVFAFLIDA